MFPKYRESITGKLISANTKLRHCNVFNELFAECTIEVNKSLSENELCHLTKIVQLEWQKQNNDFEFDYSESFQIQFYNKNQKIFIEND